MENLPTYRLTQSGPEAQEILDQVNLNTVDIEQLKRLYQALTQSEPEIIAPTDTWPVANPEENVIYRVIDRVNTPPQYYSDYMWNGTSMVLMSQYNNAIDNEPTAASNNLVKSGGVYSFVHANGGAYDISAAHAVGGVLATYDDLADALGTNGANVPAAVRKGGMSIKFVLSSDNKYVQYRLMHTLANASTADADFANTANWQGVDDKPTAGSHNLVESGGCDRIVLSSQLVSGYYSGNGKNVGDVATTSITASDKRKCFKFQVFKGDIICLFTYSSSGVAGYVRSLIVADSSNVITYISGAVNSVDYTIQPLIYEVETDGYAYIECDTDSVSQFKCYINKKSHLDYYVGIINSELSTLVPDNSLLKSFILGNSNITTITESNQLLKTGSAGETADTAPTSFNRFGYIKETCADGDVYYIKAQGGLNGRAFAFCDENNIVLYSSSSYQAVDEIVIAPARTNYIVVNNSFVNINSPCFVKLNSGAIYYLYTLIVNLGKQTNLLVDSIVNNKILSYDSYVTDFFINTSGDLQATSAANRQVNTYSVKKGRYKIERRQGNHFTIGYRLLDNYNQKVSLGPVGGTEMDVVEYLDVTIDSGTLDVFFINTETCTVTMISELETALVPVYKEIDDCNKKATNVGGLYLANNKILLCGASISTVKNAYFEYAMKVLDINGLNISDAGTNIYYLAYKLYSNANTYADYDVLIISHIHNFNVFDLPTGKDAYSVSDYEGDSFLGDYIKTTSHYSGNLIAAGGYTADELYAMGYDYVLKKWAKLCYDMKDTEGYNSVFGKPCQVVLYTYWHDARVAYNTSIRKLAKKWGFILIKDDENIGFSKSQVNPATNQQWSRLYGDTTGWQATEVIDGVIYGFHPDRMTDANYQAWQNSGILLQSYLPYIQKIRAAILVNTLKDAIIKPEQE